jgi:tRNA(fMet)-specific endonuclease VapC
MSLYVLDTDMLTLLEEGHPAVCRSFHKRSPSKVAITVLTVEEQLSGWYTVLRKAKSPDKLAWAYRRLADTVKFFARLQILLYDVSAMRRYDGLRKAKIKARRTDLRIAATVLEHSATLVTGNTQEIQHIPGLPVEDWSK